MRVRIHGVPLVIHTYIHSVPPAPPSRLNQHLHSRAQGREKRDLVCARLYTRWVYYTDTYMVPNAPNARGGWRRAVRVCASCVATHLGSARGIYVAISGV